MTPILGARFDAALAYAAGAHRHDLRKGRAVPYLAHLLGVCARVLRDGGTEDEAIAALLHDTLEDHPGEGHAGEIERRFGAAVLAIVRGCTDTPADYRGGEKAPWRERKERYVEHLRHASPSVRRVALADKVDNLGDLLADLRSDGEAVWGRFRAGRADQVWYYRAVLEALRDTGGPGGLHAELARLVTELERRPS